MTGTLPLSDDFDARPLPRSFVLELTRRCNHRCAYCYTAWGAPELRYADGDTGSESSAAEIEDYVRRLQDETPVEQIALSGGEPLLRKDLARIVSFIANRNITPVVITNGWMLSRDRVQTFDERAGFEVTLLSHRREVHDRIAGHDGAWERVIDGMTNLAERKIAYVAAFIATKWNAADLRTTAELAIALGARALMYNRMNLGAFNLANARELLPDREMVREHLQILDEIAGTYRFPIAVSVVIEPCVIDVRRYAHLSFGWCPLAGEESYFTIDPAGNIRICNHSPAILGNLKRDRFTDVYYRHPYVRRFRETLPRECGDCEPELRALCGGGCKAAAEQCYGTLEHVDPFVRLSRG